MADTCRYSFIAFLFLLLVSGIEALAAFNAGNRHRGDESFGTTLPKTELPTWTERLQELIRYKEEHGNTLVPKRYPQNQGLANWVSKQRQNYRKCQCNGFSVTGIVEDRFRILEQVGFCWDAKGVTSKDLDESFWWSQLEELKNLDSLSENVPKELNFFLRRQRIEYEKFMNGEHSRLDDTKLAALIDMDASWWKSPRERQWDARFQDLVEYKKEHGDCCVPVSTHKDRKLANWVSNMRKKYKDQQRPGQSSTLSEEQIDRLNSIGFVWDHWEYKFDSNIKKD